MCVCVCGDCWLCECRVEWNGFDFVLSNILPIHSHCSFIPRYTCTSHTHAWSRYTMHRNQRKKNSTKQTKTISMIWQFMSLAYVRVCAQCTNDQANERIIDGMNAFACARSLIHCLWREMNYYHIFYASYSPYLISTIILFRWFASFSSLTHARHADASILD